MPCGMDAALKIGVHLCSSVANLARCEFWSLAVQAS